MNTGFGENKGDHVHHITYTHQERMVGLFLFSGFILSLFFIVISVKNEHLFEKRVTFYINVNSIEGIDQGSIVKTLGQEIGRVSSLSHSKEGKIQITIEVYKKQRGLVRIDAKAIVNRLTNIGSALIEIKSDSINAPILPENSIIPVEETASLNDLLLSIANIIQATDSKKLLSRVDTILPKLENTLENVHSIIEQIASGKGTLGAAVFDKEAEQDVRQFVKSGAGVLTESQGIITVAKNRLIQIDPVLKETHLMVKDMRKVAKSLPKLMKELSEITAQTNTALTLINAELSEVAGTTTEIKQTLSKTKRLLDSVQNTWPLSDNAPKSNQPLLIPAHSNHE
ncbi:MAG: MCE family protein [Methylococcaceae bacterium]|nr:MCE family protein [Methylococcaceae bacterium]